MDVKAETVIARPREEVAAYALDPRNDTEWVANIKEVRLLTEPPTGVGSRVARVARFLGRRIEYVLETVEHEPLRRVRMRSVAGPFPMDVAYEFEDAPGGTLGRIRLRGDATGFFRLAAPLLAAASRRAIARDLESLKRRMEARAP